MEAQEKTFDDLMREDRLKRLQRQLKLKNIKASRHMSISSLSSIHGDNGTLSDFSISTSPSNSNSRAGSVVVASSNNLRTELLKNLKQRQKIGPATSSEIDVRSSDADNFISDREMMPPPPLKKVASNRKSKLSPTLRSSESGETNRVENEVDHPAKTITEEPPRDNDSSSKQRSSRTFRNWIVRLNDAGQIVIRGKLESGELARSKAVRKRLNATTLISVLNHQYHIVGDIYDIREELPEYVRGKFYNGFPTDWENVRQIWQCYVASGSTSRFRWPRPIADSDDDIRSDITEVTVSRSTRNSVSKATADASPSLKLIRETSAINAAIEVELERDRTAMDSDISSLHSNRSTKKDSNSRNKDSAIEKGPSNNSVEKRIEGGAENRSTNRRVEPLNDERVGCSNCGNIIPRRKIDVIVENMMNKNCSIQYIDKVIFAMNCFNELLTISPTVTMTTTTTTTTETNNIETTPDEGVSMNYNSNMQYESISDVVKSKVSQEKADVTNGQRIQATIARSDSFSLESSEGESEGESLATSAAAFFRQESLGSRPKQNDFRSRSSLQLTHPPSGSPAQNRQPAGKLANNKPTRDENQKISRVVVSAGEEIGHESGDRVSRYRRENLQSISISGAEMLPTRESSPAIRRNGDSSFAAMNSRRVLEPQTCSTVPEEMPQIAAGSSIYYDSDISILDGCSMLSTTKNKTVGENKRIVFTDNEDAGHKTEQNNISRNNYRTPTKSAKATPRRVKDVSRGFHDSIGSDSENISLRMSSRGRRILPRLDFWNGERVVLRDQELVYTPDVQHTGSVSSENLQQLIQRSESLPVSQSASINTTDKASNKTPKNSASLSKPATDRKKKNLRNSRVLTEIVNNHEAINDNPTTIVQRNPARSPGSKSMSGKKAGKQKKIVKKGMESSSEEEANYKGIPKRKKRRRS